MRLILVESPVKAKTISRFLGPDYQVLASYGHIRDLPKAELGIDVENNFKPRYIIPAKARKRLAELKKHLANCQSVILATDEDREGEAIAWHLCQALGLGKFQTPSSKSQTNSPPAFAEASAGRQIQNLKPYQRIAFHEITEEAIKQALKNPRDIDMNLVNSQQARRILDRLVGYKLSPLLWKKISRGLSAGRVQSVAVRIIVEREREIENFKPQEYWTIAAELLKTKPQKSKTFTANLYKKDGEVIPKLGIKSKKEAQGIVKELEGAEYQIKKVEKREAFRNPPPPFTTSALQQEAWQKLKWPAKTTMSVAQNLYEQGHITYHRTDSFNLSRASQAAAKSFIEKNYGKQYWPGYSRTFKTRSKTAQEAHEAIRPTLAEKAPGDLKLKVKLDDRQFRLYDLIWRRFIASQMSKAIFVSISVEIEAKNPNFNGQNSKYTFKATGQTLKFDGFLKVYPIKFEENELPELEKNEVLELIKLLPSQHFTQPPARFSEASLIKFLESEGIGRPSTYAPIIDTIQRRNYVQKNEQKRFAPTEIGLMVNDLLVEHFPKIVNIKFTADMEKNLDKIAQGKKNWVEALKDFYTPFSENLEKKYKEIVKKKMVEETDKKCPKCGADLVIRMGRFGKFYACSKFPQCKYTQALKKPGLNIKCPKCGQGEIVEKRTKTGKTFYGCDKYPECDYALWDKPLNEACPKCGSLLIEKGKKIVCSNKDCRYIKEIEK